MLRGACQTPYSVPPIVSAGLKPMQVVPGTVAHSLPAGRVHTFRQRDSALTVVHSVFDEQVESSTQAAPMPPAPGVVHWRMSRSAPPRVVVKNPHFSPVGHAPPAELVGLQFDEHVIAPGIAAPMPSVIWIAHSPRGCGQAASLAQYFRQLPPAQT